MNKHGDLGRGGWKKHEAPKSSPPELSSSEGLWRGPRVVSPARGNCRALTLPTGGDATGFRPSCFLTLKCHSLNPRVTPDTRRNLLREGGRLVPKAQPGLKPRSCNHGFPARPGSAARCSRATYQTWSRCPATARGEEATSLGGLRGLTRACHTAAPHPVVHEPTSQTLALVSSHSSFEVSNIISILEMRKMTWNLVLQPPGVAPSASRVFIASPQGA